MKIIQRFLQEESRWRKEIANNPNLSNKTLRRWKDAKIGVPYDRYVRGLDTGSENIKNKYGVKTIIDPKQEPHIVTTRGQLPDVVLKKSGLQDPIGGRHEADEIRSSYKKALYNPKIGVSGTFIRNHGDKGVYTKSGHASPKVIKRELDYAPLLKRYYDHRDYDPTFFRNREKGDYKTVRGLKGPQIRRIEKSLAKNITNIPTTIPEYKQKLFSIQRLKEKLRFTLQFEIEDLRTKMGLDYTLPKDEERDLRKKAFDSLKQKYPKFFDELKDEIKKLRNIKNINIPKYLNRDTLAKVIKKKYKF